MAICTLFLAVDLGAAKLSGKNIEVALLIFVVVHVIVHLILTFQHCKVRKSDLFQTWQKVDNYFNVITIPVLSDNAWNLISTGDLQTQ